MKQLKFLVSAFLYLSILACTKDDDMGENNPNIPNWSVYQYNDQNIGSNDATPSKSLPTEIWSFKHDEGDDILVSPILDDGKMYFGDREGYFYCISGDNGELIWRVDADFSISSQPAINDGRVYFGNDAENFYCIDATTGDQIWGVKLNGDIDGSPVFYNENVIISDGHGVIYSLTNDGSLNWSINECFSASKVALKDGVIYALSCEFGPVALDKEFSLKAINADNGTVMWTEYYDGNSYESTISISGSIAVFGTSGRIYGVDINSRETLWEYLVDNRITFNSSAAIKDNKVYFGGWSSASQAVPSYMECIDINSGQSIWRNRIDDFKFQMRTAAVLGSNDVLISVVDHYGLVAFDTTTGDILWNFDEDQNSGGTQGSAILSGDNVFWASRFGKVYRLK